MATYKASGLPASINNNNGKGEALYSNIRIQATDTAGDSFIRSGKLCLQGWAQLFEVFQSSSLNKNQFAQAVDGLAFGDVSLKKATVNKYLGLIEWALSFLSDESDDDDADVLSVLGSFSFVTEIESFRKDNVHVVERAPKGKAKKSSSVVDDTVARIRKMSKAEQVALREKMGW